MTRRRITLIVDDTERQIRQCSEWLVAYAYMIGVTVESVEDIPEPNRVQEFRVRVETPASENPWTSDGVWGLFISFAGMSRKSVTVTEVDPS